MQSWKDKAKKGHFQLWEYQVGHGSMLIRSPKGLVDGEFTTTNLDLICSGTLFMELPRHIGGIEFDEPNDREVARVKKALPKVEHPYEIRVLCASGNRFLIAAAGFQEDENEKHYNSSPFADIADAVNKTVRRERV